MTIPPSSFDEPKLKESAHSRGVMSSSSSHHSGTDSGMAIGESSSQQPTAIALPQHELIGLQEEEEAQVDDFSANSEDLFATTAITNSKDNHKDDGDEYWASYNDADDSWIAKNFDNSWMKSDNKIANSNHSRGSYKDHSTPTSTITVIRNKATGPFVWVFREGIDAMEQGARLVLPSVDNVALEEKVEIQWSKDGSFEWVTREDIRTVQENAASFHSCTSTIHSRTSTLHSRSGSIPSFHSRSTSSFHSRTTSSYHSRRGSIPSSISSPTSESPIAQPKSSPSSETREEMMNKFKSSNLSQSGRVIMQIQHNIISSDSSESSSEETSEDDEAYQTPANLRGKLMGNILDGASKLKVPFRNSSSHKTPEAQTPETHSRNKVPYFRSNSSVSPKPDETPSRNRRSLPSFPNSMKGSSHRSRSQSPKAEDNANNNTTTPSRNRRSLPSFPRSNSSLSKRSSRSSSPKPGEKSGTRSSPRPSLSSSLRRSNNSLKGSAHNRRSISPKPKAESGTTTTPSSRIRRSLPSFPLTSPLRRSSSGRTLGRSSSSGLGSSGSLHHEKRRIRKGHKKQAYQSKSTDSAQQWKEEEESHPQKSRSADSQPIEVFASPTITEAKTLWAEMFASPPEFGFASPATTATGKRSTPELGGFTTPPTSSNKVRPRSESTDSEEAEILASPPMTDINTLWAERSASSPELMSPTARRSTTREAGYTTPTSTKQYKQRSLSINVEDLQTTPVVLPEKLDAELHHVSSPELGEFYYSPSSISSTHLNEERRHTSLTSSFHHEQRKKRKGSKRAAFKSRSADSEPSELFQNSQILADAQALSNRMSNISRSKHSPKQKSLHNTYHHDQRNKARPQTTKHQSADSTMEHLQPPPSSSLHGPVARRKNSLKNNKKTLRQSDPGIPISPSSMSIPSSRRSDDVLRSTDKRSSISSSRRSDDAMSISSSRRSDTRNSSINSKRSSHGVSPNRNSSHSKRSSHGVSPKRNKSRGKRSRHGVSPKQNNNSHGRRSNHGASPSSSIRKNNRNKDGKSKKSEDMGLAYLQKKKNLQAPKEETRKMQNSSGTSLMRSKSNRSFNNIDSAIALMKKSNSSRKLEEASSAHSLKKKQQAGKRKKKGSKAADKDVDAAALAIMRTKKKTPTTTATKQSSARKLVKDDLSSPTGRKSQSTDNMASSPRGDLNDNFVARADKLKASPEQQTRQKRAEIRTKLDSLSDRMSVLGVVASPEAKLRKQGSTLKEKRAALRQSRNNLTNAFQRMMVSPENTADTNEKTTADDDGGLEVPMNN